MQSNYISIINTITVNQTVKMKDMSVACLRVPRVSPAGINFMGGGVFHG